MSNPISLESSIRTCKVISGWADRIQSDRFQNPDLMQCPVWNGMDTAGRMVCPDSFYTKREGCNTAMDRLTVENDQRPKYFEYITLDAAGLSGSNMHSADTMLRQEHINNEKKIVGNFGNQYGATNRVACERYRYNDNQGMAKQAAMNRMNQGIQQSANANGLRASCGM